MQVQHHVILKLKQHIKGFYPNEYALKIVEKLRKRGISTNRQQVYNFFNGIAAGNRNDIVNATIELIQEARHEQQKLEKWVNNNL